MNPQVELEALEEVIDQILRSIQDTIQSGEILSDELQGMLAEELSFAADRISELRAEIQQIPSNTEVPTPEGADLLWILAGGQPEAFVNYLQTYPDPSFNDILKNPSRLQAIVTELSQKYPEGINLSKDGIDHAQLMSSNIYGFKYDPKTGRLLIRFNSGSVYSYSGVPMGIFKAFQNGAVRAKTSGSNKFGRWWVGKIPSLGAAFYNLIRMGQYPYQKLS